MAPTCFCSGYGASAADYMERSHMSTGEWYGEKRRDELTIWISHTDPNGYFNPVFRSRRPAYIVGRSMYEFTKIPSEWVAHANRHAHEIWVPGQWVRDVFVENGVKPGRLAVMPEGIDTWHYDPTAQRKARLPKPTVPGKVFCNRDEPEAASFFKFFSNFKWEPRKGWQFLFEAYFKEFMHGSTSTSRTTLYVMTFLFNKNDMFNCDLVVDEIKAWANSTLGLVSLTEAPHFCIMTEMISEVDLAELFNAADAFVLPTRGEGWGLPIIQAMSMAKPTIATNYGGQLAFMTRDTSFLLELDGLDEVPRNSEYGWSLGKKWATPSTTHLRYLMRYLLENPAHAAAVGRRAREHIVAHFSETVVAAKVLGRLREIRDWMSYGY